MAPNSARLVGRVEQLGFFEARLDDAMRRDGSTTLLYGEPGIGKTRLLRAWTEAARARGFKIGATTNYQFARDAYASIAEACRTLARGEPRAQPRDSADCALFERFLGLFALEKDAGEAQWHKRRLCVIVREFLERVSSYAPILLTIDDFQWVDPESFELIEYLAANLTGMRVALALTARMDEMQRLRSTYEVSIGPLAAHEIRELVFRTLPPGRTLPPWTIDEVCRKSEGNPLFVSDLVRNALNHAPTQLPSTVQQSVAARLSSLPPRSMGIIEVAAALGPTIDVDLLRELCSTSRSEEIELFRTARTLGLTHEGKRGTEPPRFSHELIREAIYMRLSSVERRDLHERIAIRLEASATPAAPGILAWHWDGAHRPDRMASYAEQAADLAAAQGALATARNHLDSVLKSGILDSDGVARVSEKAGHAHDLLGDARGAYDCFALTAEHYRATGNRKGVARLCLRLATAAHRLAEVDAMFRHCREAIELTQTGDSERFGAEVLLALFHAFRAEINEAKLHLARACAFEGQRDPIHIVRWRMASAAVDNMLGNFDASQSSAVEAVNAAKLHGDPALLANCWNLLADFARQQANYPVAQDGFYHAIEVADYHALTYAAAYARLTAADMAFLRGDAQRAHELLRFACALSVEDPFVRFYAAAIGIPIALAVEDDVLLERLRDQELLDKVLRSGSDQDAAALSAAHAELRVARGDAAGARTLIRSVLPRLRNATYIYEALLKFARFGGPAEARQAASLFGTVDTAEPVTRVHALLVRAIFEGANGNTAARDRDIGEARALAAGFGFLPLQALAEELSGDRVSARAHYATIGATRDVLRLTDDGKPRGTRASQTLTKREQQVAQLVAEGLSNRAISEQLSLSSRTIEHHVAAAFEKLGLRSRTELAARLARMAMARS